MAKVIRTYKDDAGHEIAVYESGAEYDTVAKRLVKPATATVLTSERATSLIRQRREKAAAALRSAIVTETMDKLDVPHRSSVAAVAAAGGILWREIVLADPETPGVYPRDRLEAWEKLGKYAEVLPTDKRQADEPTMQNVTEYTQALTALVQALAEAHKPKPADVIEGDVKE